MKLPPTILYERRDRIATVTINRPEAMNALTSEMLAALAAAFEEFNIEKALGARMFSSEDAKQGPRAFSETRAPQFTGR